MRGCVIVANKTDLEAERKISYTQGLRLAEDLGAEGYFETSAETEQGVHELFLSIFQIADRLDHIIGDPSANLGGSSVSVAGTTPPPKRGCCGR